MIHPEHLPANMPDGTMAIQVGPVTVLIAQCPDRERDQSLRECAALIHAILETNRLLALPELQPLALPQGVELPGGTNQ